jgi:dTDP-4-dehydrorhamnose 3,5-epimerase
MQTTEIPRSLGYSGLMKGVNYWISEAMVDSRGSFVKNYTKSLSGLSEPLPLHEVFTSTSLPGVVRGFHLQVGSSENYRIIQLISGKVLDVLLDLRPKSETFGHFQQRELTYGKNETLLIPPGVAHGFQAFELSTMIYLTTSGWDPENDTGVNPLTSGFEWPLTITNMSERDKNLPNLEKYLASEV